MPFVRFQKLKDQIAKNESKTYWTFPSDMEAIKESLEKDKTLPGFLPRLGLDPDTITCLTFTL